MISLRTHSEEHCDPGEPCGSGDRRQHSTGALRAAQTRSEGHLDCKDSMDGARWHQKVLGTTGLESPLQRTMPEGEKAGANRGAANNKTSSYEVKDR